MFQNGGIPYMGAISFDPSVSLPFSDIWAIEYTPYDFQLPIVTETPDNLRLMIAAYSSTMSTTILIGIPTTLSQIDFIGTIFSNSLI